METSFGKILTCFHFYGNLIWKPPKSRIISKSSHHTISYVLESKQESDFWLVSRFYIWFFKRVYECFLQVDLIWLRICLFRGLVPVLSYLATDLTTLQERRRAAQKNLDWKVWLVLHRKWIIIKAILARRVIFVKCHFDNGGQKGATLMRWRRCRYNARPLSECE